MSPQGPLRVLAVTAEQSADAIRRTVLPLARLHQAHPEDIDADFIGPEDLGAVDGCDVLLVRAPELPGLKQLVDAKDRGARIVLDLSHHPAYQPKSRGAAGSPASPDPALGLALSFAHAVMVSTPLIAEEVRPFTRRARVVPTFVDAALWAVPRHAPAADEAVALAWTGGSFVSTDLLVLGDALRQLFALRPRCILVAMGDVPPEIDPGERVLRYPEMPYAQLPGFLSAISVGIAPRAPGPVTDATTDCMALEYVALGSPVVASPTVPHRLLAERCQTVRLAATPDEWLACLLELVDGAPFAEEPRECWASRELVGNMDRIAEVLFAAAGREVPWADGRGTS